MIVRGADVRVDNLAERNSEIITFSLSTDILRRGASDAAPSDFDLSSIHWKCLRVDPNLIATFDQLANRLVSRALSIPAHSCSADYLALEQDCAVAALQATGEKECKAWRKPRGARAEVVRRGEEYLRAHRTKAVGLIDICDELGVSARTVQYAFRERYGVGPIEYLRMLRLDAARLDLKSARVTGREVRDIASQWGFRHFSNFATYYKRHFGELPSATQKR